MVIHLWLNPQWWQVTVGWWEDENRSALIYPFAGKTMYPPTPAPYSQLVTETNFAH